MNKLFFYIILLLSACAALTGCGGCHKQAQEQDLQPLTHAEVIDILMPPDTVKAHNPYEIRLFGMPEPCVKMKINYLGGTLGRVFNDSNYIHLRHARATGIEPIGSLEDAWQAGTKLERLQTCRAYYLDNMTHSVPYLVPKAARLLEEIGTAFRDSLQSRGGGDYRVKVTSVLRTPSLARRLRRRNSNAADTSAHTYGTTFDLSYSNFVCDSLTVARTQEDMKNLLGEVVFDQRQRGRCLVKYERKQACFHITVK